MIRIIVTDNGKGAALTSKQKEHQSVGTENVKQRLALMCSGILEIELTSEGAKSVITIPAPEEEE